MVKLFTLSYLHYTYKYKLLQQRSNQASPLTGLVLMWVRFYLFPCLEPTLQNPPIETGSCGRRENGSLTHPGTLTAMFGQSTASSWRPWGQTVPSVSHLAATLLVASGYNAVGLYGRVCGGQSKSGWTHQILFSSYPRTHHIAVTQNLNYHSLLKAFLAMDWFHPQTWLIHLQYCQVARSVCTSTVRLNWKMVL